MESYVEFVPAKMARGTIVPDFIMDDERLSTGAIMVYTSLCSYSRNKNFCFPGKETLMHHARCSFNTLQKYLTQLIQYGYLKLTKINNRIFYYLFAPHKETQKNLTCDFTEVSKIETEVKELNNINILTPPTPSSEKVNIGRQKKTTNSFEGDFNKFWDCYPRKENKRYAIIQFCKLKKKQLLPPFEYFKKAVSFFMNSKQWNRENGRYIPCLSKFFENAKWEEVPMQYFEPKKEHIHQFSAEDVERATRQWEQQKKTMINNSKREKAKLEDIEKAWHEFAGKFKPEFGYRQFVTKARFIELYSKGFSFGVIKEDKNITPTEFLQNIKIQEVR